MRVNTPRGASNGFVGKMKEIRGKKMQSKKVNFFFFSLPNFVQIPTQKTKTFIKSQKRLVTWAKLGFTMSTLDIIDHIIDHFNSIP
jgi:hypothetical protein